MSGKPQASKSFQGKVTSGSDPALFANPD